ncbi:hypothetical protein BYT27DRAFT_7231085 [Phlegmacium glaucopus]|nr:hypothetical protein BYT27DRAFT_7231085 [Phlegmacium glaucopus]
MPRTSLPGTLPSPGPVRHRSLLARYGSATSRTSTEDNSSPRVPTEILDHIIALFTVSFCLPVPTRRSSFALIKPLTLVSKTFRHLVLRHYFAILVLENKTSIGLFRFLKNEDEANCQLGWTGGFVWVRSLFASSYVLLSEGSPDFASFRFLKDLWIDFRREGLMTQRPVLNFLFESIANSGGFSNLTSLTMTAVPRLDAHILKIVAQTFPSLVDLHLSTVESLNIDCCPSCFEDSLTLSSHSPIPEIYPNVEMLADAFGHSLAPLNKLSRLFLGIFLSDTRLLDNHIDHAENGTVENVFYCKRCEIYEKKTRRRELVASLVMARHLESLKHIGWSTCFSWDKPAQEPLYNELYNLRRKRL